jgi:hypothetical protein
MDEGKLLMLSLTDEELEKYESLKSEDEKYKYANELFKNNPDRVVDCEEKFKGFQGKEYLFNILEEE